MKTITIGYFISNAIIVTALLTVWQRYRQLYAGLSLWLTYSVLETAGMLLTAQRDIAPAALSIVAAQLCTVGGALVLLIGLERFASLLGPRFPNYLLIAGFLGAMIYFTYLKPDIQIRTFVIFASPALLAGQSAWLMLNRAPERLGPVIRPAGFVFLAFLAVHVYRIILTAVLPPPENLFQIQE